MTGSGAAGGRPPHMRAVRAATMAGCTALARRAPQPTAPAQRSLHATPHAPAARSGTHAAALAARHAHGRETLGLRDRPTPASAAPLAAPIESRRATARDGVRKNAQVIGRASGVCCERCWAAGLAAGRRAGAHDTCGRGRGDTGRRTESCPPRPTQPMAPAQRSLGMSAPRYGGAIRPTRRGAARMPRAWPDHAGAEGPPNASFSSAAGSPDRPRRATARDGVVKNAQVVGRASGVCCERGWAAGLAAGRRAGAHRTCGRYARRVWPAAPRWPAARRNRRRPPAAAFQKPPTRKRRDPAHTAALAACHRMPGSVRGEGPPNASFSSAAGNVGD